MSTNVFGSSADTAKQNADQSPIICPMDIRLAPWNPPPRQIYPAEKKIYSRAAPVQAPPQTQTRKTSSDVCPAAQWIEEYETSEPKARRLANLQGILAGGFPELGEQFSQVFAVYWQKELDFRKTARPDQMHSPMLIWWEAAVAANHVSAAPKFKNVSPAAQQKESQGLIQASPEETQEQASERLEKARELLDEINDTGSFLDFTALYNEKTDSQNPQWLYLLAHAYDNTSHDYFDGHKAHNLFLDAAGLGWSPAMYALATRWSYGAYGEIDFKSSFDWYRRAHEAGHGCASSTYGSLLMYDARYGDPAHIAFTAEVDEIIYKAAREGWPWAVYVKVGHFLTGRTEEKNIEKGVHWYDLLTADEICGPPRVQSALNLAFRYFLGHGVDCDMDKALKYLEKIPAKSNDPQIRYKVISDADKLRHIILNDIKPYRDKVRAMRLNTPELPPAHDTAQQLLKSIFDSSKDHNKIYKDIQNGEIHATPELDNWLWAASKLGYTEHHPYQYKWAQLRYQTQLRRQGITGPEVDRSTKDFGPTYNKLDEGNHPIIGEFIDASTGVSKNSGWDKLTSLRASQNGEVTYYFHKQLAVRPLIIQEDINVVLALTFGENDFVWPGLSLEPLNNTTSASDRWLFTQKIWDPEWIGNTQFGKTLYATDYWLGTLAWGIDDLKISECASPQDRIRAEFLINKISLCGGRSDGHSGRAMLKPAQVNWTWSENDAKEISCEMHKVNMRVDGADIYYNSDGTEDRSRNKNNSAFANGRVANLLTAYYDEIAELLPAYERLRQLNALVYSTTKLRGMGFQPNKNLRRCIDQTLELYKGRQLQKHETLVL